MVAAHLLTLWSIHLIVAIQSLCFDPSPAFPVPQWTHGRQDLRTTFSRLEKDLTKLLSQAKFDIYSTSIELTSTKETLWSSHHTARTQNATRPGARHVDNHSIYRIASITKLFTVMGILKQQKAGNLSLDDPVNKYLPKLAGQLPWRDITLRSLASQLSGIPREFAQSDLLTILDDPSRYGLPPASRDGLPNCDSYANLTIPCNESDLYERLSRLSPVFAPNQRSTYSNIAYELLGLVLEKVTGRDYESYISEEIFSPLNMTFASLREPASDDHAILPAIDDIYWGVEEGVQSPTGSIYASASDMSKYLRYILTHYNTLAKGVNWFLPASYAGGLGSFYGMPWEIFRTDRILPESQRPVTFTMKGGALPGYYSKVYLLEEYGLGLTILVGGERYLMPELEELILPAIVRGVEHAVWMDMRKKYKGRYTGIDQSCNSSLEIKVDAQHGLTVTSLVANGIDVFETDLADEIGRQFGGERGWRAQLSPTLLFKNETAQQGEIWYLLFLPEHRPPSSKIFGDTCFLTIDPLLYAGEPLTQVVFWQEEGIVELPAWKLSLRSDTTNIIDGRLIVQT